MKNKAYQKLSLSKIHKAKFVRYCFMTIDCYYFLHKSEYKYFKKRVY